MKISLRHTALACIMMLATLALLQYVSRVEDIHPIRPLSSFPTKIDGWVGRVERFDEQVYAALGVDDSFLCDYQAPDGRRVQLYIGFHQSQREGDLIHSPKHCLPGGGWNITKTRVEEVPIPGANPGKFKATILLLQQGKEKQVVLYWYQSGGTPVHSEYLQKVYLVWDAIFKNRTDGSFIRLIAPVTKDEARTTAELKEFAARLTPILGQFLPGP